MSNIIVGFNNLANSSTLSGGSWVGTLPLNNLKVRELYKVSRTTSTDLVDTQFIVDMGSLKVVNIFSVVKHNITTLGTYRLTASNVSDFSVLEFDSGWINVWPSVSSAVLEWEDDNFFLGVPSEEQVAMYRGLLLNNMPSVGARYYKLEIDDTTNPNGYIEIGRLFVSRDFTPLINASYGLQFDVTDNSAIEESLSGVEHYDVRTKLRGVRFNLASMTADEAFGKWMRLLMGQGVTGEVLFVYDPEDDFYFLERSFLGRMSELSPLETPYHENWTTGVKIKETA